MAIKSKDVKTSPAGNNDKISVNGIEFPTKQYATNTPARIRMLTLYGIGALLGNCRIANTGNASENCSCAPIFTNFVKWFFI